MSVGTRRPTTRLWLPVAALVIATVGALADWVGVELLATFLLVASVVPATTVVRRIVIGVPVFVATTSMMFTTMSVVGMTPDERWPLLVIACVVCACTAIAPSPAAVWADRVDGWSAITTLATVAIVSRAAFTWNAGDVLARLARHTDGIRHITLGAVVERHDGYVTLAADMEHLLPGLQRYPQGAAGFIATILRAVAGPHADAATTI